MKIWNSILLTVALLLQVSPSAGQQYDQGYGDQGYGEDGYGDQDFAQDNLYADYAAKQQEKAVGGGGIAWGQLAMGGTAGWLMGAKFHCSRQKKKADAKHKADQKKVYQQYYDDVYTLQEQNEQLTVALEQMGVRVRK